MAYVYLHQPVLTSALLFEREIDSFFSPSDLAHNGFAYDGLPYVNGVQAGDILASWASESQSSTRGPLATFPTSALVLVSRVSLAILDATSQDLPLWMLFFLADNYGYANNPYGAETGFTASSIHWSNGLLSVVMTPDPGSQPSGPSVVTIDFTLDSISFDRRGSA